MESRIVNVLLVGPGRAPDVVDVLLKNPGMIIRPLFEVEKEAILRAMILCNGNMGLATQLLGISRKTLYRKLSEYGAQELRGAVPKTGESDHGPGETVPGEYSGVST